MAKLHDQQHAQNLLDEMKRMIPGSDKEVCEAVANILHSLILERAAEQLRKKTRITSWKYLQRTSDDLRALPGVLESAKLKKSLLKGKKKDGKKEKSQSPKLQEGDSESSPAASPKEAASG